MKPKQLAEYFIAIANTTGDLLTNLKLQKLVYYTQAWHLAFFNKPIFEDDFQAWVHGPVLYDLYQEYKEFKWEPIRKEIGEIELKEFEGSMDSSVKEIINDIVLKYYYTLTAYQLELSTHNEDPWKNARKGLAIDDSSERVIAKDDIRNFYIKFIVKN
jgi:uncharacterized phage-associated protein